MNYPGAWQLRKDLLSPIRDPGIQLQFSWVLCFRISHDLPLTLLAWATVLSRLCWGRICFWVHSWVLCLIQFLTGCSLPYGPFHSTAHNMALGFTRMSKRDELARCQWMEIVIFYNLVSKVILYIFSSLEVSHLVHLALKEKRLFNGCKYQEVRPVEPSLP